MERYFLHSHRLCFMITSMLSFSLHGWLIWIMWNMELIDKIGIPHTNQKFFFSGLCHVYRFIACYQKYVYPFGWLLQNIKVDNYTDFVDLFVHEMELVYHTVLTENFVSCSKQTNLLTQHIPKPTMDMKEISTHKLDSTKKRYQNKITL